jgi:hypothetical protein
MNKVQQALFDITIDWNDLEDDMGENAALEVACSQHGKTSSWYYDNMFEHHEVVNPALRAFYEKDKK